MAARIRAENFRTTASAQQAAGHDHIVPLDQFTQVTVGNATVRLKVHDVDISTIDVWIDYARPVRLTKEKGITGSRTDETLIYRRDGASLYYVWEISGELNHCRLRVREP